MPAQTVAVSRPGWFLRLVCMTLGIGGALMGLLGFIGLLMQEGLGPKTLFPLGCSGMCAGAFLPVAFSMNYFFPPQRLILDDGILRVVHQNKILFQCPMANIDRIRTEYPDEYVGARVSPFVVLVDFGGRHPAKYGAGIRIHMHRLDDPDTFWEEQGGRNAGSPHASGSYLLTGIWDPSFKDIASTLSKLLIKDMGARGEFDESEPDPFKF